MASQVQVGISMGSESDWPIMQDAVSVLKEFGVSYEVRVLSAHRTPSAMQSYASKAVDRGIKVIVAGAGGAAHLPGMIAASTILPVIGVPIQSKALNGMDSLLSIVQMPSGVPVATVAIGGARNAGLLAIQILATSNNGLRQKLHEYKTQLVAKVEQMDVNIGSSSNSN